MKTVNKIIFFVIAVLLAALILSCKESESSGEDDHFVTPELISISLSGEGYVGNRLDVDIDGVMIAPVWIFDDVPNFSTKGFYFYAIKEADVGKTIKVAAYGFDEDGVEFSLGESAEEIGPVKWGWRVKTIASYLPHATEDGNKDQKFLAKTSSSSDIQDPGRIAIDSEGKVYIGTNVEYVGRSIIQVDPKVQGEAPWDDQAKVAPFVLNGFPGGQIKGIAVGPADAVYVVTPWEKDSKNTVMRYDHANLVSGNSPDWGSGEAIATLRAGGDTFYGLTNDNGSQVINGNALGDLAVDEYGNMYVTVHTYSDDLTVVKISPDKIYTRLAGSGAKGYINSPIGKDARFNYPITGITVGPDGKIYVADGYSDGAIRVIDPTGTNTVSTFGASKGWGDPFVEMAGLTCGLDGNFYVVDRVANDKAPVICKITPEGIVSRIAGKEDDVKGYVDGPAREARFNAPYGIAADADGRVYVLDNVNESGNTYSRLRMVYFDDGWGD